MLRLVHTFYSTVLLACLGAMPFAAAEIVGSDVDYTHAGDKMRGYAAYDDASDEARPGVLVVHNWMGVSEDTQRRAKMLAELGYTAFCADIYGVDHRPANTGEASEISGAYKEDRGRLRERIAAALEQLKQQPHVDPDRIAVIGYCFGGMSALEAARMGAEVKGVVSFHGSYSTPTPEEAKNITAKVLVLHGYDDPFTNMEETNALMQELNSAGVDWQLVVYGGAVHSFTDPGASGEMAGAKYDPAADRRSWEHMKQFMSEIFAE
jgi:dienelactone hydrolase